MTVEKIEKDIASLVGQVSRLDGTPARDQHADGSMASESPVMGLITEHAQQSLQRVKSCG